MINGIPDFAVKRLFTPYGDVWHARGAVSFT
jgi:hypothetical protein